MSTTIVIYESQHHFPRLFLFYLLSVFILKEHSFFFVFCLFVYGEKSWRLFDCLMFFSIVSFKLVGWSFFLFNLEPFFFLFVFGLLAEWCISGRSLSDLDLGGTKLSLLRNMSNHFLKTISREHYINYRQSFKKIKYLWYIIIILTLFLF